MSIFVDLQKLRCSLKFEFLVLMLANDFSCYLCFSMCTEFRGFIEKTKKYENWYTTNKNEFTVFFSLHVF